MGTLTEANLGSGIRVAATPIRRRKRRPSSRATPKPQYADAVLYSFQHQTFLEVSVRTTAVEDTVRRLKRAARYQERQTGNEIRVQISVEPYTADQIEADPKLKGKSLVKFLGHAPWELGRRVAKVRADTEPEPAAPGRHRRTVAKRRGQHAALSHPMVRAVITRTASLAQPSGRGMSVFPGQRRLHPSMRAARFTLPTAVCRVASFSWESGRFGVDIYREYVEITDPDDGGPPYTAEIRMCHEPPDLPLGGSNQVVVFDPAAAALMDARWAGCDMPTETWGVCVA